MQQFNLVNEPVTHVGCYAKRPDEVASDMCPASAVKQVGMIFEVAEGGAGGMAVGPILFVTGAVATTIPVLFGLWLADKVFSNILPAVWGMITVFIV